MNKQQAKKIIGRTVVSKSGQKFGVVRDISFETRTGELLYVVLGSPTVHASKLDLEKNKAGEATIPFTSVVSIGDFIIVEEEDII